MVAAGRRGARSCAGAEGVQRPLARLIGGATRDREALVPAAGDLSGSEGAEERENRPGADHGPAVVVCHVCEAGEHQTLLSAVVEIRHVEDPPRRPPPASIHRRSSTRPKSRSTPTFEVDRAQATTP